MLASNTSLGTESARSILSAASVNANVITYDFFFSQTQANVTIGEAGIFMQAAAGSGTGTLLDRTLISPVITKTSANTMLIELTLSLTSS